jgi:hypothetical protein
MFLIEHPMASMLLAVIIACAGSIAALMLFEAVMRAVYRIKYAKHCYDKIKLFDGYDVVREAEYIAMMAPEKVEEYDD